MPLKDFLFTSESVSEGHPDKMCDQISDAILDALIAEDPNCRVACETLVKTGMVVTAGEGLHKEQGAGDQGLMFGYACDETDELMPFPIAMAHRLVERLAEIRKAGGMPFLRPDSKSQVTVQYRDGRPVRIDSVVV